LFASTSSEEMAADAIDRGWMVARGQAAVRRDAETDEL